MSLKAPFSLDYTPYMAAVAILLLLNGVAYSILFIEETRPDLAVHFLDVGQADATLIETRNGNRLLIDAGGGERLVEAVSTKVPFYDQSIDVVIITHPHADHVNGFTSLIEHIDVRAVIDSGNQHTTRTAEQYRTAIREHEIEKLYARRGMTVRLEPDIVAPVLFPDRNTATLDPDRSSVWTRILFGDTGFLFTGDAFSDIERYMVSLDGEELRADVFQAGHHGSNTSNSHEFLSTVSPEYVVVSAAEDSRYEHPHRETLEVLEEVGAQTLSTSEGTVTLISDGRAVTVR